MRLRNHRVVALVMFVLWQNGVLAANPQAVAETARRLCGACHGPDGISSTSSDTIPNLAGQKERYLANVLKAYRAKDGRDHPTMHSFARTMSDEDIENYASYFASLKSGH